MQKIFPVIALLCLLYACTKKDSLTPIKPTTVAHLNTAGNCDIQSLYSPYFVSSNNFSYLKTYFPWGTIDSLAINLYGPWNINGRVKYDNNWVYVVSATDTTFKAELNSQQQVIRSTHHHPGTLAWAYYTYNTTGQLTRFQRDNGSSDDYTVTYDSLGNVHTFFETQHPEQVIAFTYDYTAPISGADYDIEYYYSVMNDLKICEVLNLINLQPHHKLLHVTSNLYPPMDNYYTNQFLDAQGKVIYYEMGGRAYTANWYCQ